MSRINARPPPHFFCHFSAEFCSLLKKDCNLSYFPNFLLPPFIYFCFLFLCHFVLLFFGGFEKHVVPRAIIEFFGTPLSFIPAKLAVVIPVIYYLNKDKGNLAKLILVAIFVLGLAQGLRNLINVL